MREIDFYFSMVSPWAYVGDRELNRLVARHGLTAAYKPIRLMEVFSRTGGVPLSQRHPARQAHRWYELQRWREARGLELNLEPAHWPFDFALADRMAVAAVLVGADPAPLVSRGLRAIWAEDANLADDATLIRLADEAGYSGPALLAAAKADSAGERYQANTDEAVAAGVFGSPTVVMDGEVFWGQDRYELLDAALAGGRAAYRAPGRAP